MDVLNTEISLTVHNRVYVLLADSLDSARKWSMTLGVSINRAKLSSGGAVFDDANMDDIGDD
jgi:hypothetical protein